MTNVILTIHVLIVLALIGVVLLQRSDGSALGLGGGGGGGFMSGSGAANALTRTTSILAALFFATSIGLAIFASPGETGQEIIEELTGETIRDPGAPATAEDLLRTLGAGEAESAPDAESSVDQEIDAAVESLGASGVAPEADSASETAEETDGETP